MKKNIEINKEEKTVTIEVSVNKRNYVKEPIISFKTKDITLLLEKEGIEIESCLVPDSIYNDGRHAKTVGKWVFKLKEEKTQQVTKPPKPEASRANNDLTDSSKPAIIRKKTKKRK